MPGSSTTTVHADRHVHPSRALAPPIFQTAAFAAEDAEAFAAAAVAPRGSDFYTRFGNPNHAQVAAVVAELEGTEAALVTASGMAALTTTVLALVSAGDHVIGQRSTYGGTGSVLLNLLPRLGISTTTVDQTDPEAFAGALTPQTRLILVETPSNPLLQITDLRAVAALARAHGALTLADNTFATPLNQRPAELGIDLVWHSATKYLNGHSDVSAGVVAGPAELLDRIWEVGLLTGATLGPIDAWLLLRGIRTLPLRMPRHNANALAIAEAMAAHPAVSAVHYPGLTTHPQHDLAAGQMTGFGGVLAVELVGGPAMADAFLGELRYSRRSASLGGVESLAVHPASMWRGMLSDEQIAESVPLGLVRLAVGIEDTADLAFDALAAADAVLARIAAQEGAPVKTLIFGGTVVSLDPAVGDLSRGDVLVEDGVIVEVSARVEAADAEVIDATDCIVMPGFVDNHRHSWQTAFRGVGADWTFAEWATAMHRTVKPHYRPEDVYAGTLAGRLEALHSGVTTMLDWYHVAQTHDHEDAAIAALRDAPGRSVFCLGAGWGTPDPVEADIRRVRDVLSGDGPVTMAWGLRGPEATGMEALAHELELAAELGLRTSLHIDAGGAGRPVADLHERGLLRDTTTVVHANGLSDDQLRMLAGARCSLSVSPDVELKMGFGWPMTGAALAAGLRPTLSVDNVPSVGGDMFSTMRTALSVQRGLDGGLSCRDVLEFTTIDAARSLGLGEQTGSLTPGKDADIILVRSQDLTVFPVADPVATIVSAGHPGLVDTVLVAGHVVKRGGALVDVDLPALRNRLLESRDRIATLADVPINGRWQPRLDPA